MTHGKPCVTMHGKGMPCVNIHGTLEGYKRGVPIQFVGGNKFQFVGAARRRRRKGKEKGRKGKEKGKKKREEERGGREEKERGKGKSVA